MKRIFQRINLTVAALLLFVFAYAAISSLAENETNRSHSELAASVAFPLLLCSWVLRDSEKRGRKLCYDYATFLFFAWPLLTPIYLFQTRGFRALLTLLYFAGICIAGGLFGYVLTFLFSK